MAAESDAFRMNRVIAAASVTDESPSFRRSPPVVCQVLHAMSVGGAEVLAKQFAERSAGVVQTVFACLDDLGELGEDLRAQGVPVKVLGRRPGFDWRLVRRLVRFFVDHHVAVIHAHQYGPFFYAAMARLPRRRPPIIFTEHGRDYPDYRRPKRVLANRLLLRRHDRVVAVGQQVKQALVDNEGIAERRIEVIYNGIPLAQFAADPERRRQARSALGLDNQTFAIVQVARLNPLKDHVTAVAMMSRLVQRHPNARLLLVGEGEQRGVIETAIAEAGLQSSIRLYGNRSDVATFLQAADAFLLTSVSEGIPLTLIEAMAAGVPCVATRVGGIPEVIVDGQSGLLAAAQSPDQLTDCLQRLISNERQRQQLAQAGQERAVAMFGDAAMHARYHSLYRQLADNRNRCTPQALVSSQ